MVNSSSNMASRLTSETIAAYGKIVQNNEVMVTKQGNKKPKKKSKKAQKQTNKSKKNMKDQEDEKTERIQQERERQYMKLEESRAKRERQHQEEKERLTEAIVLAEIIGMPRCRARRNRGYGRRYGS